MTHQVGIAAVLLVFIGASALAVAASGGRDASKAAQAAGKKSLKYEDHDLFIETNATDRDAGLQLNLDGEDWRRTKIIDPKGRKLVDVRATGPLRPLGLTELFFEASEPSFSEVPFRKFKKRFPKGKYTFRGRTVEGRKIVASDKFTHVVPDQPKITSPANGATVDPDGFVVMWDPVTTPRRAKIKAYHVTVVQKRRDLDMELRGSETSASIPGEFLRPDIKTELEVLSRDKSGNQTITAFKLRTGAD